MKDRCPLRITATVLVAAALAAVALATTAPSAAALTTRFTVNSGAEYTRNLRVSAGDAGWSPFFRPGVVVWDGGSIISGHRADPGYEFPAQTLAVVPRVVRSHVSVTSSARIADMLLQAPVEVDARYSQYADLNLCVLLAGGGDFRYGASATSVYSEVRTYCRERRQAGFSVVLLTVLPTNRPETFEATRLVYNAMVRAHWETFADGLADIAADPRIGDTGDEYDQQFYESDALHLTNAGNSVMAAVTAPVIAALPWQSARCELRLRDATGAWGDWRPYSGASTVFLDGYEGLHVVEAEYRVDGGEPVAAWDEIFVDTVRPQPKALRAVSVRRRKRVVLRYRVDDAYPCGPTCTAVVTVTTAGGRVLKTFVRRRVPVGVTRSIAFTCNLPRGSYRYVVKARDTAGNPQLKPGIARLVVR
jgi:lysophospholipase L1-like esterase